ncbi:MAG: carboxypeptidase-like regulatory domain-containing protein, partial [Flavisolibacter sp.]
MRNRNNAQQMRYRRISLLLLFQLFSIILLAQVRISGKVTADNKGLPDISVVVHNTNVGSSTDAEGNYSFQANLKPGTYQLDFSGVGYKA